MERLVSCRAGASDFTTGYLPSTVARASHRVGWRSGNGQSNGLCVCGLGSLAITPSDMSLHAKTQTCASPGAWEPSDPGKGKAGYSGKLFCRDRVAFPENN